MGYAPTVACNGPRLGLSLYYFHIVKWMSVLPQNQLLFLRTEDLLSNPLRVMMVCVQFFHIDLDHKGVYYNSHQLNGHVEIVIKKS